MWAQLAGWDRNGISINRETHRNKITIYPNPVKDIFTINLPDISESIMINITDLQGKAVYIKSFNPGSAEIIIANSNISKGIYIIQVSSEIDVYRTKFLKGITYF